MTNPPTNKANAYAALHQWISAPPGIHTDDYINRDADPAAQARQRRDYERIKRRLSRQLATARAELTEFHAHDYSADRLREAAEHANSGRLTIGPDGQIAYEAAQDERTEYRAAAQAVLADYNRLSRRAASRAQLPDEPEPATPGASCPTYQINPPAD